MRLIVAAILLWSQILSAATVFYSPLIGSSTVANSPPVGIASDQFSLMSTAALQTSGNNFLSQIASNTASALADTLATGSISSACASGVNCAATSILNVPAQGAYTVTISVTGTFNGTLLAEGQLADGTWITNLPLIVTAYQAISYGVPYPIVNAIVSNSQVLVIGGGFTNIRLRAISWTSGTASIGIDASIAQQATYAVQAGAWSVTATPVDGAKATFSAAATAIVQVAGATDIFCINGSATKTVRVLRFRISETEATANTFNLLLINRSTADSGGTSTTIANVSHDTNDAVGTATVKAYTVNPTLGTTVGTVDSDKMFGPPTGTAGVPILWQFADLPAKGFVLRGAAQGLCVNTAGTAQASASFNIKVLWTEE